MRIDSHQHFWIYDPEKYPWITDRLARLKRNFLPPDLEPMLAEHHIDGSVAVQAQQALPETRWLLRLAEQHESILGVVGWVDLRADDVEEELVYFSRYDKFVGVRHVVQDEPDDAFLLRPDFQRGIAKLAQHDLTYDLLIYPRQLPAAVQFVRAFPDQPIVLDHLAKPNLREEAFEPWATHIRELAECPHLSCKLSGLVTEAHWDRWQPDDFRRYLDFALETFGPDRLMFGSDWPVCLLAAEYERVFDLIDRCLTPLGTATRLKCLGLNAARFYGLSMS